MTLRKSSGQWTRTWAKGTTCLRKIYVRSTWQVYGHSPVATSLFQSKSDGNFHPNTPPRSHRPKYFRRERLKRLCITHTQTQTPSPSNFEGWGRIFEEESEGRMLKVSCNATDQIHALAQCRFFGPPKSKPKSFFTRRKDGAFSCSPATRGLVLAVVSDRSGAVGAEGGTTSVDTGLGSLADRLRLGSLTEDGLSYKEKFIVRSYEVGINKTATVETIANLLQVHHDDSLQFWTLLFTCISLFFLFGFLWQSLIFYSYWFVFVKFYGICVFGLCWYYSLLPAFVKKFIYFLKI